MFWIWVNFVFLNFWCGTIKLCLQASELLSSLWKLWPSGTIFLAPEQALTHWRGDKMAAIFQTRFLVKCIFLNENVWISIKMSLKFVAEGLINNISALDQIIAWRRQGDKPLSEPMMVRLLTHICVTQPQWVNNPRGPIAWNCRNSRRAEIARQT